jgi:hypothetical protein
MRLHTAEVQDVDSEWWGIATSIAWDSAPWVDRAIDAAVRMVVAGDHRPEVVAVAALPPKTSQADALDPVRELLVHQGVPVVAATASWETRFELLQQAFAHGGVPVDWFESAFYSQLPAWDDQTSQQRAITRLLDDRDHESDPSARAAIANRIRDLLLDRTRS